MASDDSSPSGPLSLQRLKDAFARMLTPGAAQDEPTDPEASVEEQPDEAVSLPAIIEGVLFVASDGGRPRPADELAAVLRDIKPEEVEQAVAELNARYQQDAAPYHIESSPAGYRLVLDEDLSRLRDKFYGRVREAKLTPAALEVLSVVAYRQPTTAATIDKLRGSRSNTLLANLVRRGLVRVDRPEANDRPNKTEQPTKPAQAKTLYTTTDRFLKLFGLEDIDQLPRAAELE